MLRNFDEVIEKVKAFHEMKRCGVCMADEAAIGGALAGEELELAKPIFVGHEDEIRKILKEKGANKDYEIINVESDSEGAEKVVELVREGKIDFILKGHIETAVLMKAVVDKEKGLRTDRLMSHMSFEQVPTYHKLITITDGGMCMYPDVEQKQKIIENAVEIYHKLGYECPKVACLSAIEKVNPKMPSTVDAGELKARNQRGEIKEYDSEVPGYPYILLDQEIQGGNILDKAFSFSAQVKMAGFIVGAKCLILLTSRSASAEEKYLSIAMAALVNK